MNKDEQIGRLTAMCETMARQLRQIQRDLIDLELRIAPYHQIIDDLMAGYYELMSEVKDGDE